MGELTYANFYSEPVVNIKDALQSNLTDPLNRYKKGHKIVRTDRADTSAAAGFVGYPYLAVRGITDEEPSLRNERIVQGYTCYCDLHVLAKTMEHLDDFSNQIRTIFTTESVLNTLEGYGMHNFKVSKSSYSRENIDGDEIQVRIITVQYETEI